MEGGSIELEKLDCNCNNCIFMVRDSDKFKDSLTLHHKWQLDYFNTIKGNILRKADYWQNKSNPKFDMKKGDTLRREANKMRFQFNKKECYISYGDCDKLKKAVTFIPNTIQLDTQACFKHRRD